MFKNIRNRKLSIELYKGILRRIPSEDEIKQRVLSFNENPSLEIHLKDMVNSREFSTMVLPNLVANSFERENNENIFFLHVPKTAGTSVRIALANILGIPSFNLYFSFQEIHKSALKTMNFWPFWSGHANINIFPNSHSGFTTFRETRSRLISQYRQMQLNMQIGFNPHDYDGRIRNAKIEYYQGKSSNFNTWLKNFGSSICNFYIPNPNLNKATETNNPFQKYLDLTGRQRIWEQQVDNLDEKELKNEMDKSFKRFLAASWIEDPRSLESSLLLVGKERFSKLEIPQLNVHSPAKIIQKEHISKESINLMREIAAKDKIAFECAANAKLISEKIPFDQDQVFQVARGKLRFEI